MNKTYFVVVDVICTLDELRHSLDGTGITAELHNAEFNAMKLTCSSPVTLKTWLFENEYDEAVHPIKEI